MNTNIFESLYTEIEKEAVLSEGTVDPIEDLYRCGVRFHNELHRLLKNNNQLNDKLQHHFANNLKNETILSKIRNVVGELKDANNVSLINHATLISTFFKAIEKVIENASMNKNDTTLDKYIKQFDGHLILARGLFNQ